MSEVSNYAIEQFTEAVKAAAARDGISEDEAAANLAALLMSDEVQEQVATALPSLENRVASLEERVAALESR